VELMTDRPCTYASRRSRCAPTPCVRSRHNAGDNLAASRQEHPGSVDSVRDRPRLVPGIIGLVSYRVSDGGPTRMPLLQIDRREPVGIEANVERAEGAFPPPPSSPL
jgi:hypothetical protein